MRTLAPLLALTLGLSTGCDLLRPPEAESPTAPPATPVDEGPRAEVMAVDWLGSGTLYAGTVIGRRGDLTGVRYADGEREWVEASRISALPSLAGREVTVWARSGAAAVTVIEERDGLVHVRFANRSHTWFERAQLYTLSQPSQASRPPPPDDAPTYAPRRPTVESLRVGAWVFAYWDPGSGVNRSRPWIAEIASLSEAGAHLRYRDGSEGEAVPASILRVFAGNHRPRRGERVWLRSSVGPVGRVVETRADLFSVEVAGGRHWVDAAEILGPAPPAPRARVAVGSHVTALWHGTTPYHGDVTSLDGESVTVQWHDGSPAEPVPLDDIVEIWESAPL